jgi:hypothetical protein
MTRRTLVPVLVLLGSVAIGHLLYAQAQPAVQGTSSPPAPAKWVPPLKGEGTIEVIKGTARRVGNDLVTTLKIKNTSKGALALLTADEYWYGPSGKDAISGDTQRHKALLNPGDIVELTMRSPIRPQMAQQGTRSLLMFRHANGTLKAKQVPKFTDGKMK